MKDFKTFALKGNVVDLAVAVIIGAAFGKIIASLVADIIMPPIGLLVGGVNFTELSWVLKDAVGETAAITINYGNFLQVTFDFIIVAFAIFMAIKGLSNMKKQEAAPVAPPAAPTPTKEEILLTEIRDLLKATK